MLSSTSSVLVIFIAAMITENLVFARAIGSGSFIEQSKTAKDILLFGLMLFSVSLPAGIMAFLVKSQLGKQPIYQDIRWIVAAAAVAVSFGIVHFALRYAGVQNKIGVTDDLLISAAFGCATLAVVLLSLSIGGNFLQTVVYCVGSNLGLTCAMLLLHSGRERLEISKVRKSFQGFPISLIYLGILSMAIYGLTGHQLLT